MKSNRKTAINSSIVFDEVTGVAFVDICEAAEGSRIEAVDVSEDLGLNCQVIARVDDNGVVLGLIIVDYPAFRRAVRVKYAGLAVERILELIIGKVKGLISAGPRHQPAASVPC